MRNSSKFGLLVLAGGLLMAPSTMSATPITATLTLTFNNSGSSSTSSGGFLSTLTDNLTQLVISGAAFDNGTYSGLSDTFAITGGTSSAATLGITGALNGALSNITAGTKWIQFNTAGISETTAGGNFVLSFPSATTSPVLSATLLQDLGFASVTSVTQTASGSVSNTTGVVGSLTYSINVTGVAATPEPASFLMLGSGLIAAGFFGRRRLSRSR